MQRTNPAPETGNGSRQGRFPAPTISYAVAITESRRTWRKLRSQDVWFAVLMLSAMFLLLSLPVLFGFGRDFGRQFAAGTASLSVASGAVAVLWLVIAAFAVFSGVGSEGEVDEQAALLAVRPPKDIAGGLLLALVFRYALFFVTPLVAAGAGFATGVGTPAPLAGFALATLAVLVTAVSTGYAVGLWLKGLFRRTPWLARVKPVLGVTVLAGYFWLAVSGRLWNLLTAAGAALSASPLGWLADLAFVTTAGADIPADTALAALALTLVVGPLALLAVVRAAEYAWYVDTGQATETEQRAPAQPSPAGTRLDAALAAVGVRPATRGVAIVTLVRAKRAPLQLAYVAAPLLFALPSFEPVLRVGTAPTWAPWLVLVYGAWAAGAAFPLNVLGNQGATLPTLLTSPARGRSLVRGNVLASVVALTGPTALAAVATGALAGRPPSTLVAIALATPVAVTAGAVLAAGAGAVFPRFHAIDLTSTTKALLPSKIAFGLFSIAAVLAVSTLGILADQQYRLSIATLVSAQAPLNAPVSPHALVAYARVMAVCLVVVVPLAYVFAVRRIETYRL